MGVLAKQYTSQLLTHTWEDKADGCSIITGEVQDAGAKKDQIGHHTIVSQTLTQLCAQNAQHYT